MVLYEREDISRVVCSQLGCREDGGISLFFSNIKSCFSSTFTDLLYDMVFAVLVKDNTEKNINSEQLLLALRRDIEIEFNVTRIEQSCLCRIRCKDSGEISFKGSPLSILLIEARLM